MSNDSDILNSASRFGELLRAVPLATNPPGRVQVPDRANSAISKFPVKLASTDPEDDKYNLRATLVDPATGNVPGVGRAVAPEEYFAYAQRKEDENFAANFKKWLMQNADLSTPESADYWYTNFPFIKELKYREIDREAELQKRFAKIAATGPNDIDDWMLLYMKDQGMVTPSRSPLYLLSDDQTYTPGIFSMFNWVPRRPADGRTNQVVTFANPIAGRGNATNGLNVAAFSAGTYTGAGADAAANATARRNAINANVRRGA